MRKVLKTCGLLLALVVLASVGSAEAALSCFVQDPPATFDLVGDNSWVADGIPEKAVIHCSITNNQPNLSQTTRVEVKLCSTTSGTCTFVSHPVDGGLLVWCRPNGVCPYGSVITDDYEPMGISTTGLPYNQFKLTIQQYAFDLPQPNVGTFVRYRVELFGTGGVSQGWAYAKDPA